MMTLTDRIELDIQTLKNYFEKLFGLKSQLAEAEQGGCEPNNFSFPEHSIAPFIKPDMACNVYNLVDYWMKELCCYQEKKNRLAIGFKDIKGKDALDAYQKYLTKVAAVDLSAVERNYKGLQSLRKVRNKFIHDGGHILSDSGTDISNISGVRLSVAGLIVIDDSFIWESLDHAKVYLCSIAQALQAAKVTQ